MRFRAILLAALASCASFSHAQQEEGQPAPMLIQQGLRALQVRDLPKAQELLERATEQAPEEPRAWIGLAQVYRMLNLHAQAQRHAAEAARLGENAPRIQHALAMFHGDYGNWAEAARWEAAFARSDEGDANAYLRAVALYLQADMPLQAIDMGEEGLERSESAPLRNSLGKAFAIAQQPEAGLRHLQRAVEAQPYEESFHYDLGYFHLRRQDFKAAKEAFLAGREYFDKSAAIEIGLGISEYGLRRFAEAVDSFLRAAEFAPAMEQPHAFLGRLLQHATDRLGEVEERMRLFHQQHSQNHFGPLLYGQVLLARLGANRDPDALAVIEGLLRESIERREDYWESHYELGVVLEKKRDFSAAEERFRRAAELNPDASKPHYRLARVYQRLGKTKEAKRERTLHRQITERERRAMQASGLPAGLVSP